MPETNKQRQFYAYHRGEILKSDETVFDVAAWMGSDVAVIDTGHKRTHLGQAFATHHNSSNLADGSNINVQFETGAVAPHLIMHISGKFDHDFDVLESPSTSAGTAHVAYNKNRTSATTSTITVKTDVTISADGTNIAQNVVGEGQRMGGATDFEQEWILKASTTYVFRLTSRANSNRVHINLAWYEPS